MPLLELQFSLPMRITFCQLLKIGKGDVCARISTLREQGECEGQCMSLSASLDGSGWRAER